MKVLDLVSRAGRSLRQAKARTLLTSLAIAVGAFTLTITLAASEGAREYADRLIKSNFDPAALLVYKDKKLFGDTTSGYQTPQEYDPSTTSRDGTTFKELTQDDINKIKNLPGVDSVQPNYQVQAQYITRNGQKKYTASDIQTYTPGQKPDIAAGSLPSDDGQLKDGTIVLPNSYASVLGLSDFNQAIGKTVTIRLQRQRTIDAAEIQHVVTTQGYAGLQNLQPYQTTDETFTIAAISKKSATSTSNTATIAISANDAKRLSEYTTQGTDNYQKYLYANVRVHNGTDKTQLTKVQQELSDAGFQSKSADDLQKLLVTFINILQYIVGGFGVIALIASVFGIVNTQYISVLERTREIGLMKALGMRKRDISWLFRLEAMWIGFLGGVIGAGIAWAAGTALNPWLTSKLDLGAGNHLLIFQIIPVVILIIVLMLIAMIAGLLPARKAAKLDPIEALRTE